MTTLEITLIMVLYILLGLWVCNKRDWYEAYDNFDGGQTLIIILATIFAPLNFLIVFIREFTLRKWRN